MSATTYSRAQLGVDAPLVTVEADVSSGLPTTIIVGLPETAVREAKDRVKAAIQNAGYKMPQRRVTVNLAPADLPKQGGRYDLAIALAILGASNQLSAEKLKNYEFLGELSLEGDVRSVNGVLPAALHNQHTSRNLVVPLASNDEAALAANSNVRVASHLSEIVNALEGSDSLQAPVAGARLECQGDKPKLSDVQGQQLAKRALKIAAAGKHNLLFFGPPGTGKTMLANRLSGLLPPLTHSEALASAAVHSISGSGRIVEDWGQRPFRAPHHTASAVALVGGGNPPRPGEISLAHLGVLFLDEFPEFTRQVLEVMREPLESGGIVISRAKHQVFYPADFQLIAAMNPCPCGYHGDGTDRCHCRPDQVDRYLGKISGPLLDRIDLHVEVPALNNADILRGQHSPDDTEHQQAVEAVEAARQIMMNRAGKPNADLSRRELSLCCQLSRESQQLLELSMQKMGISMRGYIKILKIARTIADLAGIETPDEASVAEAISYRRLDRSKLLY